MSEQTQMSFPEDQNKVKSGSSNARKLAATLGATAGLFVAGPAVSAEAATHPSKPAALTAEAHKPVMAHGGRIKPASPNHKVKFMIGSAVHSYNTPEGVTTVTTEGNHTKVTHTPNTIPFGGADTPSKTIPFGGADTPPNPIINPVANPETPAVTPDVPATNPENPTTPQP